MPFSVLKLHPNLLKAIKELGFARPTPIQSEAIPPAMAGRDLLACASTGSGKTAAFLLPILHKLIDKPRRTTRALVLTPTRGTRRPDPGGFERPRVHTPVTAASIFGGVGMGPQEHAFRTGADVMIATPGRLLDHLNRPYAKLNGLEFLVLMRLTACWTWASSRDPEDPPASSGKRQTLFFSATMPPPIATLTREMLHDPATINQGRQATPAVGITQALYPVPQELKSALFLELLKRGEMKEALVFTRTKHRTDRLQKYLVKNGIKAERIHGNRSQPQRTEALAGFKSGQIPGAGGHRHCGPRHRRNRPGSCGEFRRAGGAGGLHPPGGAAPRGRSSPAMPSPSCHRKKRETCAVSSAPSGSDCRE